MGLLALDEFSGYVIRRDGMAEMVSSAGIVTPCEIPGAAIGGRALQAGHYDFDMKLIADMSDEGQDMPTFKRDQPVCTRDGFRGTFIEYRSGFGICRVAGGTKFQAFKPSALLPVGVVTRTALAPRAAAKEMVSHVAERLASAKKIRAEARARADSGHVAAYPA